MEIRYDEDLVEAAVTLCAAARPPAGPDEGGGATSLPTPHPLQIARFHREREKLYAILDPDERNEAFFRLHLEWFREWGLESLLTEPLKEFPLLPGALGALAFRQARRRDEEAAELYVNETGRRTGVVALRPDRFHRPTELAAFLRHELMHLHDMVDPAFGYAPDLELVVASLSQQRLARERYRLLWAVTIDGRLTRAGRLPLATREQRRAEFAQAFAFWPEERQRATFEALWSATAPTHQTLAALVTDPRDLRSASGPQPGAPCPLCGFPSFDWADLSRAGAAILKQIQSEFPNWAVEDGVCRRCLETYEVRAKYGTALDTPA